MDDSFVMHYTQQFGELECGIIGKNYGPGGSRGGPWKGSRRCINRKRNGSFVKMGRENHH